MVNLRPVVKRRNASGRGVVGRLQLVAVHVTDLRADLAEDGPRDQPIRLRVLDAERDVLPAQLREIVERFAIHAFAHRSSHPVLK
jgi:hypothetical protein